MAVQAVIGNKDHAYIWNIYGSINSIYFRKIFWKRTGFIFNYFSFSSTKDSNIDIAVGTGSTEHQEVDFVNNFSKHYKV